MSNAALKPPTAAEPLYETDFYAWTQRQAELLRARRFGDLDLKNLIEEVTGVGISEKREIRSRLPVLIAHLLKWKYQPGGRSSSWRGTIDEQRTSVRELLDASPSLRRLPSEMFDASYRSGRLNAAKDTGIDFTLFPATAPFTIEQVLDDGYFPKEPDLLDQS